MRFDQLSSPAPPMVRLIFSKPYPSGRESIDLVMIKYLTFGRLRLIPSRGFDGCGIRARDQSQAQAKRMPG